MEWAGRCECFTCRRHRSTFFPLASSAKRTATSRKGKAAREKPFEKLSSRAERSYNAFIFQTVARYSRDSPFFNGETGCFFPPPPPSSSFSFSFFLFFSWASREHTLITLALHPNNRRIRRKNFIDSSTLFRSAQKYFQNSDDDSTISRERKKRDISEFVIFIPDLLRLFIYAARKRNAPFVLSSRLFYNWKLSAKNKREKGCVTDGPLNGIVTRRAPEFFHLWTGTR